MSVKFVKLVVAEEFPDDPFRKFTPFSTSETISNHVLPIVQTTFAIEIKVLSAHRDPESVHDFSLNARSNGYKIIIGAAGMAAHLAGAIKANTTLPVIGVPLEGGILTGLDSLLSTLQMPKGVPVATMTVGKSGAINAAILSAEILALSDESIGKKLIEFKENGAKL